MNFNRFISLPLITQNYIKPDKCKNKSNIHRKYSKITCAGKLATHLNEYIKKEQY